ncbi:LETM1 domain-containing protein 1 [Portunus trituberculatus]|uniref:LETM1 domain-containing protein 1 n=1 Tax=Portunus trituberculatus TaxID=210409 RepID=A0A5B7DH65_PORTR|nr:LETM1 domain-containing protein 1 [Portunus trituberculatus]
MPQSVKVQNSTSHFPPSHPPPAPTSVRDCEESGLLGGEPKETWPRRGCKSQQCLYYWSSLWPWGDHRGHIAPLQVCTIHTAITRVNSLGAASVHGAVEKQTRRDVMPYIPQSFPAQHCASYLGVWRGMTTETYVPNVLLDRNERIVTGTHTFEPCLSNHNVRYLSGQAQKQVKEIEDEKTGKTNEVPKGDVNSTVIKGNAIASTNKNDQISTTGSQQVAKEGDRSNTVILDNIVKDISKNVNSPALGSEQLPSRVQRYFLGRYTWYLRRFHESLKNEMPDTFNMFHIFTVGLKEFMFDFKELIKILVYLSLPGSTLASLSHRELELYFRMPYDMVRVFPVLVLSSLPFGQNVAFPIGYWFPRHLLCYHFWDIKQRHEFAVMGLKQRLFNARPVFSNLMLEHCFGATVCVPGTTLAVFLKYRQDRYIVTVLPVFLELHVSFSCQNTVCQVGVAKECGYIHPSSEK